MEVKITKAEEYDVVVQRLSKAKEMLKSALAGFFSKPVDETEENMTSRAAGYRTAYAALFQYNNEGKEGYKPWPTPTK